MLGMSGGAGLMLVVILGALLWVSCFGFAVRLSGRQVDTIRRTGRLDELWGGLVLKRQVLGALALFCLVTLVPVEVMLLRADSAPIGLSAGLAVFGLAPAVVYFGFIRGANYVLDNPDDGEIVERRRAARKVNRSS
jgi:hypothetical protein